MSEKISVIVPVYNVEKYLRKCMESIINQTYSNLEIIIIDDGSTDMSGSICDEYAKKDERVVVFHQTNKGMASARNSGIELSTGEWIYFIDSDDYIELNLFDELFKNIQSETDIIVFDKYDEYKDCTVEQRKHKTNQLFLKWGGMTAAETLRNGELSHFVWDKLFRKKILNDVRFFEGMRAREDRLFLLILSTKNINITYIPKSLYHYNHRSGSMGRSRDIIVSFSMWNAYYYTLCNFENKNNDIKDYLLNDILISSVRVWRDCTKDFFKNNKKDIHTISLFAKKNNKHIIKISNVTLPWKLIYKYLVTKPTFITILICKLFCRLYDAFGNSRLDEKKLFK